MISRKSDKHIQGQEGDAGIEIKKKRRKKVGVVPEVDIEEENIGIRNMRNHAHAHDIIELNEILIY